MTSNGQFTITLLGDLMLGRLIDQLLPTHVDEPEEADIVSHFRQTHPHLQQYIHKSPWGNALDLFCKSDLVLGNLETSMTTHNVKWPDKVFNYRMHPDNVQCLTEAGINYVSLANNHTLDFCKEGLFETISTLKHSGIAFAGAGLTPDEARLPSELTLPVRQQPDTNTNDIQSHTIQVHAFSDHPDDWSRIPEFNHTTHTPASHQILQTLLSHPSSSPSLKIVSLHWGPNYTRHPSPSLRTTAHYLIDHCAADVIWGHSAHHIQGVEIYKSKLIIYGCGDFIDDYAVNAEFRSDLGAVWNLVVEETEGKKSKSGSGSGLVVRRLEVFPSRCRSFQARVLDRNEERRGERMDHEWVVKRFRGLCEELGTRVREGLGDDAQVVVDVDVDLS